jgi:tellurite resistance protein
MSTEATHDLATAALHRLVAVLAEDAMFVLAAGTRDVKDALEGLYGRRLHAYSAALQGTAYTRMTEKFDAWVIQLVHAMAPIAPPVWVPMMEVVREKVTLEIGARGLRSLFSSKPSEKDVQRVKRYGSLAVRTLRAVFAADGPLDKEESTTLAAVVAALGLPEADANALYGEAPVPAETLDVYGEIEQGVARALMRGAWLAAAWDSIDPREEQVVRVVAHKVGVQPEEVEAARTEAQQRVDARRMAGLAAVDGIRFLLSDRVPGHGVQLAALAGTLMLPRRYRDEALAQVGHGAPITLANRYASLSSDDKMAALGIAWAAGLVEDPTVGRRAILRARWERFAADVGEDDAHAREVVETWVNEMAANGARSLR